MLLEGIDSGPGQRLTGLGYRERNFFMKRVIQIVVNFELDENVGCEITPAKTVEDILQEQMTDIFASEYGYESVAVSVIDTQEQQMEESEMKKIRLLEERIKNLEKSNRNWRRKCQRIRQNSSEKERE